MNEEIKTEKDFLQIKAITSPNKDICSITCFVTGTN